MQTLTMWFYLMCHLQDKLALGEQLGWLAEFQGKDDKGLKYRALLEADNHRPPSGERKSEIAFTHKHCDAGNQELPLDGPSSSFNPCCLPLSDD